MIRAQLRDQPHFVFIRPDYEKGLSQGVGVSWVPSPPPQISLYIRLLMDSCGYSKLFNKWGTPGAGSIGGAVGGPQSTMHFEPLWGR